MPKRLRGFILAEVAISVALLATLIVGIYEFIDITFKASRLNGERTQALYLAAQQQEAAKLIGINILNDGTYHFTFDNVTKTWGINPNPTGSKSIGPTFYFSNSISTIQTNTSGNPIIKKNITTICWKDIANCGAGENKRKIVLISYIGK